MLSEFRRDLFVLLERVSNSHRDLKVISRTSVMQYKSGVARNLREIGKQLGVAHLLQDSVQRAGGKLRVNAQPGPTPSCSCSPASA